MMAIAIMAIAQIMRKHCTDHA